jgi:hypothetical protein
MGAAVAAFDWIHPPEDELGGIVPLDIEAIANPDLVIALTHLTVYPQGFSLRFIALTAAEPGELCSDDEGRDLALRFGVEFADGRRSDAKNHWILRDGEDSEHWRFPERLPPDRERDIFITGIGGGSLPTRHRCACWIWPLPPPGPLTLRAGWPAAGAPVQSIQIDAGTVLDAAAVSRPLWEDE